MKKFSVLVCILVLASHIFAYTGEIIDSLKTPGQAPTGLTCDGKFLWLADRKTDRIYQIDIYTRKVLKSIPSPSYWPVGLAFDGEYLWNADKKTNKIYQINPENGLVLKTIEYTEGMAGGLTWDGKYLWVADEASDMIMKVSPEDGTTITELKAPFKYCQGLTFNGNYLWATDRVKDEIYLIEPKKGKVLSLTDAPGKYARGMAIDGEGYLWVVDYHTKQLYKIITADKETFQLKDTRKAKVTFTHEVKNLGPGLIRTLDIHLAMPVNRDNQEILGDPHFPDVPTKIVFDQWNQRTALFHYDDVKPGDTVNCVMETKVKTSAIRYFLYPEKCGNLAKIPRDIRNKYLVDDDKYQLDNPLIQDVVKSVVGDEKNSYWIARNLFDYLIDNMYYQMVGGWNTAPTVLERGNGSCSEYAFVYIALCRAAGLPARYVGSVVVRDDDSCLDDVFHRWVEVYFPGYGWVPVDPSGGDKDWPAEQASAFGGLSNRFLITTQSGGGSKTMGWTYNSNEFYTTDPKTNIISENFGEWEPLE